MASSQFTGWHSNHGTVGKKAGLVRTWNEIERVGSHSLGGASLVFSAFHRWERLKIRGSTRRLWASGKLVMASCKAESGIQLAFGFVLCMRGVLHESSMHGSSSRNGTLAQSPMHCTSGILTPTSTVAWGSKRGALGH